MLLRRSSGPLVLAIAPVRRGFGYAVFDGVQKLIDWGLYEDKKHNNRESLKRVRTLFSWYLPDVLVLPNLARQKPKRAPRVIKLMQSIRAAGSRRNLNTRRYSRVEVRSAFAGVGARSRHAIAQAIVVQVPDLELWLPPKRVIWKPENPHMGPFDAAALAFTYFHLVGGKAIGSTEPTKSAI
jgi:hypothetical protein